MNYKKDFPIFKNNPKLVYLDSAATSQKPQIVLDTINDYYLFYNANIHRGLYPLSEKSSTKVEEVRKKVQEFIKAKESSEIIFTKGATEGINLLMYSLGQKNIKKGDTVVTTIMDHHVNFVPWQQLASQKKAKFEVVGITDEGTLDEEDLMLKTTNARILALPYVSNVLGSINNVENIIKRVRGQNSEIIIILDAAQSMTFLDVDVRKIDCDFLVFSGHKIFAETGVGVLYGRKELLDEIPPFLFGGDMIREVNLNKTTFASLPNKFEAGTSNISGIISLGSAIDYIKSIGIGKIKVHEKKLVNDLIDMFQTIGGIEIIGPKDRDDRSNIISFVMQGVHPHDIAQVLADEDICIRSGHHCTMPLHAFLNIPASSRISLSIYNTGDDIEKVGAGIKKVKKIFKK